MHPYLVRDPWRAISWALIVAATVGVLTSVILFRDAQMDTDEAVHARDGQEYARALRSFDLDRLSHLLTRPQWHPPAHGLSLGAWFVLFGSSVLSARLYSVAFYFLLGITIWATTYELCKQQRSLLAFAAVLLFALDAKHATAGGVAMLEGPSSFFALLALLIFTRAGAHGGRRAWALHAAATCAALVCFMTRYSHGIAVLGAIAAAHALGTLRSWPRERARSLIGPAIFVLMVAAVAGTWLVGLGQLKWLLAYSGAQPRSVPRWSLANAAYYPSVVFVKTPFGPFVLGAFIVSLGIASVKRRLRYEHAAYLFYLVIGFAILFFVRQKTQRFGILILTPLWVLTAALVDLHLPHREPGGSVWRSFALAAGALLVGYLGYYKSPFPTAFENVDDGLTRIYRTVGEVVEPWRRPKTTAVLLGRDDLRCAAALAFSLESECDRRGTRCEVSVLDEADFQLGWPRRRRSREDASAALRDALIQREFVVRYGGEKDAIDGRPLLLEQSFAYQKKLRSEPIAVRVTIHGPRDH